MFYDERFPLSGQHDDGFSISKLTSVYWGFFSGGARNVHTDVIAVLQAAGIQHNVISYYDLLDRGSEGIQSKIEDRNYRKLISEGITVDSLGLTYQDSVDLYRWIERFSGSPFPTDPLEQVVRDLAQKMAHDKSNAILCLKEQPVNLLVLASRYLVEVMGLTPKPIFVTLHRTDPLISDPKAMQVLQSLEDSGVAKQYIAGYIGCSESSIVAYQQALGLLDEDRRFQFVANGIDLQMFRPKKIEEMASDLAAIIANQSGWDPQPNDQIITMGARNHPEKNIDLFMQAAYLMLQSNPHARVVLCGSGMDKNGLQDNFFRAARAVCLNEQETKNLHERIHPLGRLTGAQMASLLNISAVVALTSPPISEADPLVLKEGMACGAVPVTTCCGDAPRVVGVENPREVMLTKISSGSIVGSRGILTSQNPSDIAAAWQYALSNASFFKPSLDAYRSELCREVMGHNYKKKVAQWVAAGQHLLCQSTPSVDLYPSDFLPSVVVTAATPLRSLEA